MLGAILKILRFPYRLDANEVLRLCSTQFFNGNNSIPLL